jgi:hypothetical protein
MAVEDIESDFPNLERSSFAITSDRDDAYNCIAWAAGSNERWWEPTAYPGYYWPDGIPRTDSVDAAIALFAALGYGDCAHEAALEQGFEKVAIYGRPNEYTHAARQLDDGRWTSKLGPDEDIVHDDLYGLTGDLYGDVMCVLKRPR